MTSAKPKISAAVSAVKAIMSLLVRCMLFIFLFLLVLFGSFGNLFESLGDARQILADDFHGILFDNGHLVSL